MQFTLSVPARGDASDYALTLVIHGRDPGSKAAFVSIQGEERLASIQSGELAFSRPVTLRKTGVIKIMDRIALDDLPASLRSVLHAVFHAGSELDLEFCEQCSSFVPAGSACIKTVNLCTACAGKLKSKPLPEDEIPF